MYEKLNYQNYMARNGLEAKNDQHNKEEKKIIFNPLSKKNGVPNGKLDGMLKKENTSVNGQTNINKQTQHFIFRFF